jgi:hypothetical protein
MTYISNLIEYTYKCCIKKEIIMNIRIMKIYKCPMNTIIVKISNSMYAVENFLFNDVKKNVC